MWKLFRPFLLASALGIFKFAGIPTKAQIGAGTLLKRGDGGNPETFTTVIEVEKLDGPNAAVDMKDATNMSSPTNVAGRVVKEVIPGLIDPGTLTLEFAWVPGDAQHAGIYADMHAGILRNWQLAPSNTSKVFSGAGYVKEFAPSYALDDKIIGKIAIEISGPVTFA